MLTGDATSTTSTWNRSLTPPGFHDKAAVAFLDYPRVAEIAELFVRTDALPGNYWIDRGDQCHW